MLYIQLSTNGNNNQSTYVCFVDAKKLLTLYKETVYGTN